MASTDIGQIHISLSDVNYSSRSKQLDNETCFDASVVSMQLKMLRFRTNVLNMHSCLESSSEVVER